MKLLHSCQKQVTGSIVSQALSQAILLYRSKSARLFLLCILASPLIIWSCQKKSLDMNSSKILQAIIRNNNAQTGQEDNQFSAELSHSKPIYQYYQKIPQMTGVTNDPENLIFNLQIELGYEVGDVKTLEKLSKYGIKIAGKVRQSMAAKTKVYLSKQENHREITNDILTLVNKIIAPDPNDTNRVKDIIITELLLHDYR